MGTESARDEADDDIKEMVNSLPDVVFKEWHTINHHVRGLTGPYR